MKVGILGGLGFLGSRLATHLWSQGHEVRILSRQEEVTPIRDIQVLGIEGLSASEWAQALDGLDSVVDLVSSGHWDYRGTAGSARTPLFSEPQDLVTLCRDRGVGRYVFVSSGGTVYGAWRGRPWRETDRAMPTSEYGRDKLRWEDGAAALSDDDLEVVVVRPSNAYGPSQMPRHGQGLVAAVIWASVSGTEAQVWGGLDTSRDYIHVDDLACGLAGAIQFGVAGERYNLGSQRETTTDELLSVLSEALSEQGVSLRVRVLSVPNSDISRTCLDTEKARRDWAWPGVRPLGVGIHETVRDLLRDAPSRNQSLNWADLTSRARTLMWARPRPPKPCSNSG